jgi:hypothetical protein
MNKEQAVDSNIHLLEDVHLTTTLAYSKPAIFQWVFQFRLHRNLRRITV